MKFLPIIRMHPRKHETIVPGALEQPARLAKRHRPLTWLAGAAIVLLAFLLLLPPEIRTVFWHSIQSQFVLVSMLLVFCLVAVSLVWSAGQRLDANVFLLFNMRGARPYWLDQVMLGFTQFGNGFLALAIAVILFIANNRLLSYELILGTLTLWLVVELVKLLIHRPRPFIRLARARIVGYRARGRSFPSGHTCQSFFMATLIAQHFQVIVWVAIFLYALALFVGITRMYVGAHYPRDVLAGAILGSVWGLVGVIVDNYIFAGFR